MSSKELGIRAWKDSQDWASLSTEAELGEAELNRATGGAWMKAPTWKYIDGTPDWAIANAISMGYEVERLD